MYELLILIPNVKFAVDPKSVVVVSAYLTADPDHKPNIVPALALDPLLIV